MGQYVANAGNKYSVFAKSHAQRTSCKNCRGDTGARLRSPYWGQCFVRTGAVGEKKRLKIGFLRGGQGADLKIIF